MKKGIRNQEGCGPEEAKEKTACWRHIYANYLINVLALLFFLFIDNEKFSGT